MKEYANTRYQQPYQTAMYEAAVLLEARRWHTDSYEAVIPDMQPLDLTVRTPIQAPATSDRIPYLLSLCLLIRRSFDPTGTQAPACLLLLEGSRNAGNVAEGIT